MTSDSGRQDSAARRSDGPGGPPFPIWMYGVINPAMRALLRSPFHGLLSKQLMLLDFLGRRSGKRYSLPVGYLEQGRALYVFTHSGWAANLRAGAPVTLRLRGKVRRGRAETVGDADEFGALARLFVARRGEQMARQVGLRVAGDAVESTGAGKPPACIRIELED